VLATKRSGFSPINSSASVRARSTSTPCPAVVDVNVPTLFEAYGLQALMERGEVGWYLRIVLGVSHQETDAREGSAFLRGYSARPDLR
jgi:hypothetical protein